MPCNIGWKFMTGLMVLEMVMSFISSFAWGLGFVGSAIKDLLDRKACLGLCLTSAQVTIDDIQMFACGLYAVTGLAAGLAIFGLLSGQLWLQVPNVAVSFIRLVGSLVIGEYLIQVNMGMHVFTYNRIIMYFCLVVNFITFTCNFAQANREYKRTLMERNGILEPQVRPLTNVFGNLFGTTASCCICTPPIIAEGVLPDMPEHVVEATQHNDLLDGVVEANTPGPRMNIDAVNGRDQEGEVPNSVVSPEIGKKKSCSVNLDDEILLDIEYGNDSLLSE